VLFGISKSAAGRVVDHLGPSLALSPVTRRHPHDTVLIVDGTLVPTHDRSMSAFSKNYRSTLHMPRRSPGVIPLTAPFGRPPSTTGLDFFSRSSAQVRVFLVGFLRGWL
jgi:hypothetical protein